MNRPFEVGFLYFPELKATRFVWDLGLLRGERTSKSPKVVTFGNKVVVGTSSSNFDKGQLLLGIHVNWY